MTGDGVPTKKWWQSKMMLLNGAAAALVILEQVQPFMPPQVAGVLVTLLPIANMILRPFSKAQLTR